MILKLPFGLKDGTLVEVSKVEKGLECGCVCPACGHTLIARKGEHTVHHFAHYKSSECAGAFETALHMAAKDILEKHKKIRLPAVTAGKLGVLYKAQVLHFDKVFLERKHQDIIPDLTVEANGKLLFIEIAVTHSIDAIKRVKIEKMKISTLEFNLSKVDRQITIADLERILIFGDVNKTWIYANWIYNIKEAAFINEVKKLGKGFCVDSEFPVVPCSLSSKCYDKRPYADLIKECLGCKFLIEVNRIKDSSKVYATCIGNAVDQIEEIILRHKKS